MLRYPMARHGCARHRPAPAFAAMASLVLALSAIPAAAQLRPLDPLPFGSFDVAARPVAVQVGFGVFTGQRASLAGTEGTLAEIGNFRGIWRTGRVALEVGGTVLRTFEDVSAFAEPASNVSPESGPHRNDAGDYRVATSVRLTPGTWPVSGFVRFGTRLPTTDNTTGLDRDRTDFFATLGGHADIERWALAAEAGVGVFGTRHHRLEQSDVLLYAGSAEYRLGTLTPGVLVLGHLDGIPDGAIRGSEELSELRVGARAGRDLWVSAYWVHGLTAFSPRAGLLVAGGWAFR